MNAAGACFFGIAFLLYFLSGILYLSGLTLQTSHGTSWARPLARGAFLAHTLALLLHAVAVGHAPFTNSWESLSFFAWSLTLLFHLIDARSPQPGLGAFVLPLGFLALFFASTRVNPSTPLVPVSGNQALKLHIAITLMGYGSLALAFCAALVYLVQENRLKRKRFGGPFHRMLSLEQADLLAGRAVGIGFALLTLGLLMGLNFAFQDWQGRWWLDAKVLSSVFTWSLYAVYLYAHSVAGWRGRRTMLLLVAGFAAVLISYVGINVSGVSGRHDYPF